MKLVTAIVHSEDAGNLVDALLDKEFRATRLQSSGGFLKQSNATVILGVDDPQVDDVLDIVRDIEDVCPTARFLNYTNPMSMLVWALAERSQVATVGLCHSVYWTVRALADYTGVPWQEVEAESAGVNHLAFILRLEHRGRVDVLHIVQ